MQIVDRAGQLRAAFDNLDTLIRFADGEQDDVLAATLEHARAQLAEKYPESDF